MTTAAANIVADNDTTANFRLGGAAVNAQLAAVGLIQTSDTGQVNWTTVSRPSASDNIGGYEIWRFNDTLQATVPVFIRLEYRASTSQTNHWNIWITVGFSTDGAGNILGTQKFGPFRTQGSILAATLYAALPCLFSGSTNRIAVALFTSGGDSATGMFFAVERSKDASGADTGEGLIIWIAQAGLTTTTAASKERRLQFLPFTGGVPTAQILWPAIISTGSSAFGGNVAMGTVFPIAGTVKNPGISALVYNVNDFSSGTDYSMTVYGTSRNYRTLGDRWGMVTGGGNTPAPTNIDQSHDSRIAMRYE